MSKFPEHLLDTVYTGDVFDLMRQIPDESVDMVYSDPDYNVGIRYEGRSYTRRFDEYIEWYIELAKESLRVLKPDGNMFFINYPKQNAYLRVKFLDQHCHAVHDYVWVYDTAIGHNKNAFTTAHRSILHCTKSEHNKFFKEAVAVPYSNPNDYRIRRRIEAGSKGRTPYSWFYIQLVNNVSLEKTFHPCQIPQELSRLLVLATTQPNDVVLVHFGGSGSELEVCRKLQRYFVSAEIEPKYVELIRTRLEKGYIPDKMRMIPRHKNQIELFDENADWAGETV